MLFLQGKRSVRALYRCLSLKPRLLLPFLAVLAVAVLLSSNSSSGAFAQSPVGKDGPFSKVGGHLSELYKEHQSAQSQGKGDGYVPGRDFLPVTKDGVVIDAVASDDAGELLADLEALGLQNGAAFGSIVSGRLPVSAIEKMAALDSLRFARPSYMTTNVGLVDSQGDIAMRSDDARALFGVTGAGTTVGVLSDSYNCLGGAAADVASGDLPAGVNILAEISDCTGATDEGRAMMQLIHDVAPGAGQVFHTAFEGKADFAQGILDLAAAGADVIVDDVGYPNEPMFQDGIIAQAVDTVAGQGVSYFSSAGNEGRKGYQSSFNDTGLVFTIGTGEFLAHDFGGGDVFQSITIPEDSSIRVALQWDEAFFSVSGAPGATNDLDIFLLNATGDEFFAFSADDNIGGDPVEVLGFVNPEGSGVTQFNLLIARFLPSGGVNPGFMKYVVFGP